MKLLQAPHLVKFIPINFLTPCCNLKKKFQQHSSCSTHYLSFRLKLKKESSIQYKFITLHRTYSFRLEIKRHIHICSAFILKVSHAHSSNAIIHEKIISFTKNLLLKKKESSFCYHNKQITQLLPYLKPSLHDLQMNRYFHEFNL